MKKRSQELKKKWKKTDNPNSKPPEGAVEYKDIFYVPDDERYFTSEEKIEEYLALASKE